MKIIKFYKKKMINITNRKLIDCHCIAVGSGANWVLGGRNRNAGSGRPNIGSLGPVLRDRNADVALPSAVADVVQRRLGRLNRRQQHQQHQRQPPPQLFAVAQEADAGGRSLREERQDGKRSRPSATGQRCSPPVAIASAARSEDVFVDRRFRRFFRLFLRLWRCRRTSDYVQRSY